MKFDVEAVRELLAEDWEARAEEIWAHWRAFAPGVPPTWARLSTGERQAFTDALETTLRPAYSQLRLATACLGALERQPRPKSYGLRPSIHQGLDAHVKESLSSLEIATKIVTGERMRESLIASGVTLLRRTNDQRVVFAAGNLATLRVKIRARKDEEVVVVRVESVDNRAGRMHVGQVAELTQIFLSEWLDLGDYVSFNTDEVFHSSVKAKLIAKTAVKRR